MLSMTGFGSALEESRFGRVSAEVRSVNNRFLELNFRLGASFLHLEPKLRTMLRDELRRGKVDVTVRFEPAEDFAPAARVNTALVQGIVQQMVDSGLATPGSIAVETLLTVPGALIQEADRKTNEELDAVVCKTVAKAVEALVAERSREGATIAGQLLEMHGRMKQRAESIAAGRDEVVAKYRERLHARIEELLGPKASSLDPGRLEQEVTIFADKADISEEVHRLAAHLDALEDLARKKNEAVGKSLEFLSQEILREVNTTGSKCRDLEMAQHVLELKKEVESLRELVANVE